MKNKIQLITYADSLGENLEELKVILDTHFQRELGGVHILPFYPSSADRGFSPLTHLEVDGKFGDWGEVREIGGRYDLVADLVVNHISSESAEFQDFLKKGQQSEFKDFFITARKFSSRLDLMKIDPRIRRPLSFVKKGVDFLRRIDFIFHKQGVNKFVLKKIYRPRLGSPFEKFSFADGKKRSIWCTFSKEQVDLDINNPEVEKLFKRWIEHLGRNQVKLLRLDAVGYCAKKRGTTGFMIPETYRFIEWLARIAHRNNMQVLPEIHNHYTMQLQLAKTAGVDYVYDFCLPLLVLHSIFEKNSKRLKHWLKIRPHNQITTLDTHDGIGIVDVEGLVSEKEAKRLSEHIFENGGNATMRASGTSSKNVDIYQINTTYYSALGEHDTKYLIARAIQFFVPGIPQVYYVGMLVGKNDEQLLKETSNGRDINRHYYSKVEIEKELSREVVKRMRELMIFRNEYPAFNGKFKIFKSNDYKLDLRWEKEEDWCELRVDFRKMSGVITYSEVEGRKTKQIVL